MEGLGEGIKKILLAGIGTAAVTAEKSKELLEEMVKKGELTVEQGKVLNEELKHNIKKTVQENVDAKERADSSDKLDELIGQMSEEQLRKLKEKLQEMEADEDLEPELNQDDEGI